MSEKSTALVWFRRDLRLQDNPALTYAIENYEQILPVFIHAPHEEQPWQPGAASNWWLHHSLLALQKQLQSSGASLTILQADSLVGLRQLIDQYDVSGVFWNRLYEPALIERDTQIKQSLRQLGLDCQSFAANLLNEPHTIANGSGKPYRVFSAYWRSCEKTLDQLEPPLPAPRAIKSVAVNDQGVSVDELGLLPAINWYQGFEKRWQPGEAGAWRQFERFLQAGLADYQEARDLPVESGTSLLSAHLHFGEISPRQIIWSTNIKAPSSTQLEPHRYRFFAELGWREFGHYLLYHFPNSQECSLDQRFDAGGWVESSSIEAEIERWQRGQTGIPLVDAGMRELWHTGWMHNRVRMIVASLLSKNLGAHWLVGARWFWDTLVDADLASNSMGWQWTAGCGVDAAPYFRVFSPQRQTERFDKACEYIKQWVPELANVDNKAIINIQHLHERADYPEPMLDLSASRKAALQRWDIIKNAQAV